MPFPGLATASDTPGCTADPDMEAPPRVPPPGAGPPGARVPSAPDDAGPPRNAAPLSVPRTVIGLVAAFGPAVPWARLRPLALGIVAQLLLPAPTAVVLPPCHAVRELLRAEGHGHDHERVEHDTSQRIEVAWRRVSDSARLSAGSTAPRRRSAIHQARWDTSRPSQRFRISQGADSPPTHPTTFPEPSSVIVPASHPGDATTAHCAVRRPQETANVEAKGGDEVTMAGARSLMGRGGLRVWFINIPLALRCHTTSLPSPTLP